MRFWGFKDGFRIGKILPTMISKTTRIAIDPVHYEENPVETVAAPEFMFVPGTNGRCRKYELLIKEGDRVFLHQKIGLRDGGYFKQNMFAPCSGTFLGLEKHSYRNGKELDFLKFQNDFKDEREPSYHERSDEEIFALTPEEVISISEEYSLVGLGGSSFPTHVKLKGDDHVTYLVVNGIECEPTLPVDKLLMANDSAELVKGLRLLRKTLGSEHVYLCIKKKYAALIAMYQELLREEEGMEVKPCRDYYPQGWEIGLIKDVTGIKVPSGALPRKQGVLDINVATVVSLYQACRYSRPVSERYFAVIGDGIEEAKNFRVRVGTPVKPLIESCRYKDDGEEKTLICGGPMMGVSVPSDDLIMTPCLSSVLVYEQGKAEREQPCIHCASCVYSCPTGLVPVEIMNAYKGMDKEKIKDLHPERCVECGLCSYSCTSSIRVLDYVRKAKIIAKLPR